MIKERLEELIKQRGKVWSDSWHELIQLDPSNCYIKVGFNIGKYNLFVEEDEEHCPSYCLDNLREDWERAKAEYEWKEKVNSERNERFEPPMWEDIYQKYVFRFIHKNTFCMLRVEINRNIEILQDLKTIKIWDATKENYEKACEIVRDLF